MELSGITVLEGREECARALRDPSLTSDPGVGSASVLLMDGPSHTRVRSVVREIIAGLEPLPDAVRREIEDLVGELGGSFDLVADFARPVAGAVAGALLGVALDDVFLGHLEATAANLDVWSGASPDKAAQASAFRLAVQLSRAEAAPGSGLAALRAARAAGRITEDELLLNPVVLAHAAYENSLNFLAVAGLELASDPELAVSLRSGAGLVRQLAAQICPARYVLRSGREGAVAISLAGGLPFGLGRHACPGSGVALAEGEVALRALAEVLAGGCRVEEVRWKPHPVFHGLAQATVTRADG